MQSLSRTWFCLLLATPVAVAGCASPPVLELQEAREALAAARDFEADVYAPDQYDLAIMNLEMAEVEIKDQEAVPAMARSYDRALAFIDRAIADAEQAQLQAEDLKAQAFLRAEEALPVAQAALDDASDVLGRARPFLAFQEAQALRARLDEMAVSLGLARQLMDEGGFADAGDRLDAIITGAQEVQRRAEFVMETAPR